ncbi:MAG: efflux RND transporter permease subunit [Bdellovibrionales bacterium]|nr:efflux RND transporter permease subunit [Bdellovibrionales bacterium]
MNNLIIFFVKNYKFTLILTLGLVTFGMLGLSRLNSESYPSVDLATATIVTNYPGAAPEEIEEQVTKPLEDEIRTVRGLKDTRSVSQAGQSKITVRVDMDHFDVGEVMDDLQKAIQRVTDLPPDIKDPPRFQELNSEEFPAIELAIIGTNENRKRDAFADVMKESIEDNKKVLNVRFSGFREREFSVKLLQRKLDALHVSISEVNVALKRRNINIPAGNLESSKEQMLIKLDGKVSNVEELRNVYIRSNFSGKNIQLKDVALIEDGMEDTNRLTRINGLPATLLTITKKAGEDTIELVEDIQKQLSLIQTPKDLSIVIYNDEAGKVKNRMQVLESNALTGLVLVFVCLLIFLPGKVGVVASLSLPIAVLGTLGAMMTMGMNLDAITVLALVIALGMLVDNSVVISENFSRIVKSGVSPQNAAVQSAYQFWLPISCTAFTTIAAFLPMLVTKGVMGEFIKFIPIIVSFALGLSLCESFCLLPARLQFAAKTTKTINDQDQAPIESSDWFQKITTMFEKLIRTMIRKRYFVLLIFTFLITGSLFMLVKVNKFILFPAEQTEIYIARFELPPGTPVEKTDRYAAELSTRVYEVLGKDVKNIVSQAGIIQAGPNDPKEKESENVGMLTIYVTREASFDLDYVEALAKLRKIDLPGSSELTFEAQINGPPVGDPVNATFRSNSQKNLESLTAELTKFLETVPGVIRPHTDQIIGDDEIRVMLDYLKVSRLGLDVAAIGNALQTALGGTVVTEINLNNRKFDLRVKYAENNRENLRDLENIDVMDPFGNLIPIASFAKFERHSGSPVIKRFDFQRAVAVLADIDPSKITSVHANGLLLGKFEKLRKAYPDITVTFGGEQESTNESLESLSDAMVLALIAIFGILVFLFSSYLRPIIIMSTIPLGLLGFAVAFYFHDRPVSFLAILGVIGLTGIIVNSGIVLVSFIDELRDEGKLELHEILAQASGLRLRAVVVTSLTTIGGLFPTAYGIGGSDLILIPMTLAMAWGLTSGTILTLAWVPCAYAILEDWNVFTRKIFNLWRFRKSSSASA